MKKFRKALALILSLSMLLTLAVPAVSEEGSVKPETQKTTQSSEKTDTNLNLKHNNGKRKIIVPKNI